MLGRLVAPTPRATGEQGRGLAIAGLVIGYVGIVGAILAVFAFLAFLPANIAFAP